MANVPNVPGVPALPSYSGDAGALLTADAFSVINLATSLIFPQWGIFLNGRPVIQPSSFITQQLGTVATLVTALGITLPITASFKGVDYDQDYTIATYPIEGGLFQTYDKVQLPFNFRVQLMAGGSQVRMAQFIALVDQMASDFNLYDIVTPAKVYVGCNVTRYGYRRSAEDGVSLLTIDVWFQQIRVANSLLFSDTQSPADAGQVSSGVASAQVPTLAIQSGLAGGWQ